MGTFDLLELSLSYVQYLVLLFGFQPRPPFPEWTSSPLLILRAINLDAAKWVDQFRDPDAARQNIRSFIPPSLPIDIRLTFLFVGTVLPFVVSAGFVLLMGQTVLSLWLLVLLIGLVFVIGGFKADALPIEFVDPTNSFSYSSTFTILGFVFLGIVVAGAITWLALSAIRKVRIPMKRNANHTNNNNNNNKESEGGLFRYKLELQAPIPRTLTIAQIQFNDTMELTGWGILVRLLLAALALVAALASFKVVNISVLPFFSVLGGFSTTMGVIFATLAVVLTVYIVTEFFEEGRVAVWEFTRVVTGWLLWISALVANAILIPIGSAVFPIMECVDSSKDCPAPYFRLPDPSSLSYVRTSTFDQQFRYYDLTGNFTKAVAAGGYTNMDLIPAYCQPLDVYNFPNGSGNYGPSGNNSCPLAGFSQQPNRVFADHSVQCADPFNEFFDTSAVMILVFYFFGFALLNFLMARSASTVLENEFPLDATQSIGLTPEQIIEEKLVVSNNVAKLIYGPFKLKFRYWRVALLVHKFLVVFSAVAGFDHGGIVAALALAFCFHTAMAVAQIVFQPYQRRVENYLALSSLLMLSAVSFIGLVTCARAYAVGRDVFPSNIPNELAPDSFYIALLCFVVGVPLTSLIVGYTLTRVDDSRKAEARAARISDAIDKAITTNEEFTVTGLSNEEKKKIKREELNPETLGLKEGSPLVRQLELSVRRAINSFKKDHEGDDNTTANNNNKNNKNKEESSLKKKRERTTTFLPPTNEEDDDGDEKKLLGEPKRQQKDVAEAVEEIMTNGNEGLMFQVDVDSATDSDNDVIMEDHDESSHAKKKANQNGKDDASSPTDNNNNNEVDEEKKIVQLWKQGAISTHQKARMILECRERKWTEIMEKKLRKQSPSQQRDYENGKLAILLEKMKEKIQNEAETQQQDENKIAAVYQGIGQQKGISITARKVATNGSSPRYDDYFSNNSSLVPSAQPAGTAISSRISTPSVSNNSMSATPEFGGRNGDGAATILPRNNNNNNASSRFLSKRESSSTALAAFITPLTGSSGNSFVLKKSPYDTSADTFSLGGGIVIRPKKYNKNNHNLDNFLTPPSALSPEFTIASNNRRQKKDETEIAEIDQLITPYDGSSQVSSSNNNNSNNGSSTQTRDGEGFSIAVPALSDMVLKVDDDDDATAPASPFLLTPPINNMKNVKFDHNHNNNDDNNNNNIQRKSSFTNGPAGKGVFMLNLGDFGFENKVMKSVTTFGGLLSANNNSITSNNNNYNLQHSNGDASISNFFALSHVDDEKFDSTRLFGSLAEDQKQIRPKIVTLANNNNNNNNNHHNFAQNQQHQHSTSDVTAGKNLIQFVKVDDDEDGENDHNDNNVGSYGSNYLSNTNCSASVRDTRAAFGRSRLQQTAIDHHDDPFLSVPPSRRKLWEDRRKALERVVKYKLDNFSGLMKNKNNNINALHNIINSPASSSSSAYHKKSKNLWFLAINEVIDGLLKDKIHQYFAVQAQSMMMNSVTNNDDDNDDIVDGEKFGANYDKGKRRKTKMITVLKRVPKSTLSKEALERLAIYNNNKDNKMRNPLLPPPDIMTLTTDSTGAHGQSESNITMRTNSGGVNVAASQKEEEEVLGNDNNNAQDHVNGVDDVEMEVDEEVSCSDESEEEVDYRPLKHHPSVVIRTKIGGDSSTNTGKRGNISGGAIPQIPSVDSDDGNNNADGGEVPNNNENRSVNFSSAPASPTASTVVGSPTLASPRRNEKSNNNNSTNIASPLTKSIRRRNEKKALAERQEFGFNKAIISYLLDEHKQAMKTYINDHKSPNNNHNNKNNNDDDDDSKTKRKNNPLSANARAISFIGAQAFGASVAELPLFNESLSASVKHDGSNNNNKSSQFVGASTAGLPPRLLGKKAKELFQLHQTLSQPIMSKEDEEKVKKSVAKLHEQHMKFVSDRQAATDYRIDRDNILWLVIFFLIISLASFVAMVLALVGIVETTRIDKLGFLPVSGAPYEELKLQYAFLGDNVIFSTAELELAGYRNWTSFVDNCCCAAFSNQKDVDAIAVEKWLCQNGKVKERIRKTRSGADDALKKIRPLCGRDFVSQCKVVSDVVFPYYALLTGCNSTVTSIDKRYW